MPGGRRGSTLVGVAAIFTLDEVGISRGGHRILRHVSAEIPHGGLTALMGESGAGKSTLLRVLNRLTEPDEGRVLFHGEPVRDLDVRDLRRRVALVQQQPVVLTETVLDDLRLARADLTEDEAAELLPRAGLAASFVGRSTEGLSGGEAQRLCFARALAMRPEVLLLDEPTSALDSRAAREIEQVTHDLAHDGLSVVLVSHDLDLTRRLADHLLLLAGGTLAGPDQAAAYLAGEAA